MRSWILIPAENDKAIAAAAGSGAGAIVIDLARPLAPGLQAAVGRTMRRQAKNSATSAAPMKIGRYGSNTVRLPIHAPLNPKAIKTSGPRQQADARMAASPPAKSAPRPFCGSDIRLSFQIWFG